MRGGYSGRGGFGAGRHGGSSSSSTDGRGYHGNPCLTMHQPWASLLVHGIKRVEGRSWPSPITGRLWIHAASKVPDPDTIKAMEDFYREIYAVDGITDIKFPDYYPVSRLLGCVEVVGCLRSQELVCWEDVPQSVRLEGLTDFCWLCENPQKLVDPFEMRGYQGVYNLERRIYDGAVRGLTPVQGPLPIKFPLPDPRDRYSLKPGSLTFDASKSEVQKSSSVTAAIAGARAAATQFSKRDPNAATSSETRVREQSWGNRADSNSDHQNLPSVQRGPYLQNQSQPEVQKSSSVTAAISGARAAATQFSKRDPNAAMSSETRVREQSWGNRADSNSDHHNLPSVPSSPAYLQNQNQPSIFQSTSAYSQNPDTEPRRSPRLEYGASNRWH